MGKKKDLKKIASLGWWRSKLRKYKWSAVALGAATGGMKMIASHGLIGMEDLIFPLIGMITGGAITNVVTNVVDDALEDRQELRRDRLIFKERKLIAEKSGVSKAVADKAGGVHRTL